MSSPEIPIHNSLTPLLTSTMENVKEPANADPVTFNVIVNSGAMTVEHDNVVADSSAKITSTKPTKCWRKKSVTNLLN